MSTDVYETEAPDRAEPEPAWVITEQALLGAVLLSGRYREVETTIKADMFQRPAHQLIWTAISTVATQQAVVEPVTVMTALLASHKLREAGEAPYLHQLVEQVPTGANVTFYARQVAALAAARKFHALGAYITAQARPGADTLALESEVRIRLSDVHTNVGVSSFRAGDLMDDFVNSLETPMDSDTPGIVDWPYRDLSEVLLPICAGQLIIVAARPRIGKSVVLLDIARHAAINQQKPTVFHSLEMGRAEVMTRLVASLASVSLTRINRRELHADDWRKISKARVLIEDAPLFIDDRPTVGTADIRASIRAHAATLAVVDYIQLIDAPGAERRLAVEANSRNLKIMAKEEQVGMIVAAQLNRGSESREGGRPRMSDLRETGGLEQDADAVILLHREDAEEKESARAGEADFIVAKQRNGPTGDVVLAAQLHMARFADMAYTDGPR